MKSIVSTSHAKSIVRPRMEDWKSSMNESHVASTNTMQDIPVVLKHEGHGGQSPIIWDTNIYVLQQLQVVSPLILQKNSELASGPVVRTMAPRSIWRLQTWILSKMPPNCTIYQLLGYRYKQTILLRVPFHKQNMNNRDVPTSLHQKICHRSTKDPCWNAYRKTQTVSLCQICQ